MRVFFVNAGSSCNSRSRVTDRLILQIVVPDIRLLLGSDMVDLSMRDEEGGVMATTVLTLEEVASYLRVHPSTIYRMLKRQQIPAFKVGSDWRFNLESIDRWRTDAERRRPVTHMS